MDDRELGDVAAMLAAVLLSCIQQLGSETAALQIGIDSDRADISAVVWAQFDVDQAA